MSIMSFPERGPWGRSNYRGNASGYVYQELFQRLNPSLVIDPCVGGNTSVDVGRDMGIEVIGLDLHLGFNLLRDSILRVVGREADLVVSHFPYHDMIKYSGNMYPDVHPDDMSRCPSVEDFLEKSQVALLNQRDATRPGGHYATLIGDQRKKGKYYSFQADFIKRMPADELAGVIIKQQHNCVSDRQSYAKVAHGLPLITHEYMIVWRKPCSSTFLVSALSQIARSAQAQLQSTWRAVVRQALIGLGGEADLKELYQRIGGIAQDKIQRNPNCWMEKVRQTLQLGECFVNVRRGRWSLS